MLRRKNMNQKEKSQATRQKIIEVSARLFLEKGFDKTSMRDIVEGLGMSKGAIYHQFASKEEIMQAVNQMQDEMIQQQIEAIKEEIKEQNGQEKIRTVIKNSLENQMDSNVEENISELMKSPEYILKYMRDNISKNAPLIAQFLQEGNEDGSLSCEYTEELAEAFLLMLNIWCDPTIFEADKEKVMRKLKFIQQLTINCGADVIEEEVIDQFEKLI